MEFIDTHCHLDDAAFVPDLPEVLESARSVGVCRFINIGYEPGSWERSLALAERYLDVAVVLGMHPNSADLWTSDSRSALTKLLEHFQPVAIGEIGLDYFRNYAEPAAQRRAFRDQLELARQFQLPVVIHMRGDVEPEIIAVLEAFPDIRAIMHSFDGTAAFRDFLLERGDAFGVGGLMTRPGSAPLRAVLEKVPLESIILETDSPYLVPKGVKGRRNTPAAVPAVAAALADLLHRSIEEVARVTTSNAERMFGLVAADRTSK